MGFDHYSSPTLKQQAGACLVSLQIFLAAILYQHKTLLKTPDLYSGVTSLFLRNIAPHAIMTKILRRSVYVTTWHSCRMHHIGHIYSESSQYTAAVASYFSQLYESTIDISMKLIVYTLSYIHTCSNLISRLNISIDFLTKAYLPYI